MSKLCLKECFLGYELYDGDQLVALYRAREELAREESPKPCFAPIYTPGGQLVTEYRPKDHLWHTGLYYGWVHVNEANLWGGPWYLPESGKYEYLENTHGRQAHETFEKLAVEEGRAVAIERITWRDAADQVMAEERRSVQFEKLEERPGTFWRIQSEISPAVESLTMGASRAARYSGLELRMGPPFADAAHRDSEGLQGHENIMKSHARWCCAIGAVGGAVVMMDHPENPRHPTAWFTRKNLMGAGLLMEEDLETRKGEVLNLRYGLLVLEDCPSDDYIEKQFEKLASQ